MPWKYERKEREFAVIPEGEYRIRIYSADKAVSKSGRDMLSLQFEVSGRNDLLYHYIVFLEDRPEITNRMLTQFFDSFKDIPEGDFNLAHWIGKVGACKVKHEESTYNDSGIQARIHYFIAANKQDSLPPWSEPTNSRKPAKPDFTENASSDEFMPVPEGAEFDTLGLF